MSDDVKSVHTVANDIFTAAISELARQNIGIRSVLICLDLETEADREQGTGFWYRLQPEAPPAVAAMGTLDAALRCLPLLWHTLEQAKEKELQELAMLRSKLLEVERELKTRA